MTALPSNVVDCLIVGAGPAGLAAATHLARYRREVCLIDGGASRTERIPRAKNVPGFPDGLCEPRLLERIRQQAEAAGVVIARGSVAQLVRQGEDFLALSTRGAVRARCVLLATGSSDREPIDGLSGASPAGAAMLGAQRASDGRLEVDLRQQTSVPGLYAAGDVGASRGQVAVAFAEGAVAATAIHRALPPNFR